MRSRPDLLRATAFIDGQNLYHSVRRCFGSPYPDYDVQALSRTVCRLHDWHLEQVRFYTGVPNSRDDRLWRDFWVRKLAAMGRQGVIAYSRPLRYCPRRVMLPDGRERTVLVGEEKGIDVRLALDVIRMAHRGEFDVAFVFSQDQDLAVVAEEIRVIAREQDRWIKIASAFPIGPACSGARGIDKTDWIAIDRRTYRTCLDHRDYGHAGHPD